MHPRLIRTLIHRGQAATADVPAPFTQWRVQHLGSCPTLPGTTHTRRQRIAWRVTILLSWLLATHRPRAYLQEERRRWTR